MMSVRTLTAGFAGIALAALLLFSAPQAALGQNPSAEGGTDVRINGVELGRDVVQALEHEFGVRIATGDYWYDALSGLYGLMGGPGLGFTVPGLQVGGPLRADVSGGGTSVFVNDRELHAGDVAALTAVLGPVSPGRYWLRHDGSYGDEGGQPLGNLIYLAQQAAGGPGYNRTTYGGYLGSDGQTSYFFDRDSGCSVISGGGVSC